jgi:hypothetical protein
MSTETCPNCNGAGCYDCLPHACAQPGCNVCRPTITCASELAYRGTNLSPRELSDAVAAWRACEAERDRLAARDDYLGSAST